MFAKAGLCFAATSFTLVSAARLESAAFVDTGEGGELETVVTRSERAEAEAGPDAVTAGVRETEVRHCALYNFQSFIRLLEDCDGGTNSESAMTEAIEHQAIDDSVTMTRNDAASLVTMSVDMSLCAEGLPAIPCLQSLPPLVWLRQFWRFEDLAAHAHLHPADQAKARLLNRALGNLGVSASRLHSRCERDVENPAFEIVRECVVDSLPAWSANHTVGTVQGPNGEMVDLSNQETLQASLEEWLRAMWEREDMVTALHHSAGYFTRRSCSSARTRVQQVYRSYEASILATGFPLERGVTQVCLEETPSTLVASGTLDRIFAELSVCELNDGNCTAAGMPCPEGFSCDCQRRSREGAGLAAGAVIGGVAGLAVATALPAAIAGGAALAMGESAAAWASASLLLGGKAEVAAAGSAAGTQELSTTCGCFPLECEYNEEREQCEMSPSATASPSSNPFSTLPFTGLKCTEHRSHHWFHSGKECALTECDRIDTSRIGPHINGQQWFGRVGRSPHWEETGLYNCASTEGTVETLMSRVQSLPQGEDVPRAENTVDRRIDILQQYTN